MICRYCTGKHPQYREDLMIKSENYALYIKWEKRFELGIPVLDKQHKMLVSLCNELYFSIMEHRSAGANKNWQLIMSKIIR